MRILWFNWRDIKNPDAGGAEVFTHEVMRRLVKKGYYEMTLFTSRFSNSLKCENIDGVRIIRNGNIYTVHYAARKYYKKYKNDYDLIIDEINVKPFLTPKFVKEKPILALIHEVAGDALFFQQLFFPLNYIVYYYLVRKWLSYYKDLLTVTISNSTKQDLEAMGFTRILVVPEGLSINPLPEVKQKESNPTIVFIGRLKRYKLPDHALCAFSLIKKELPDAKMWIIGDGYMRKELEKCDVKDVTFYGHIRDELKYILLSKSHLILVPSVKEGWGLVVTESNAMGTPAVAYNVSGLKDSVIDGETGVLVKDNSPQSLARSSITLLKDRELLSKISSNALSFSRQFSWDNTANIFGQIIKDIV